MDQGQAKEAWRELLAIPQAAAIIKVLDGSQRLKYHLVDKHQAERASQFLWDWSLALAGRGPASAQVPEQQPFGNVTSTPVPPPPPGRTTSGEQEELPMVPPRNTTPDGYPLDLLPPHWHNRRISGRQVMAPKELAHLLGISDVTLNKWRRDGKLPFSVWAPLPNAQGTKVVRWFAWRDQARRFIIERGDHHV